MNNPSLGRSLFAIIFLATTITSFADPKGNCLEVTATDSEGRTSTYAWSVDQMHYDADEHEWYWDLKDDWEFWSDDGTLLATLTDSHVEIYGDPSIAFSFSVTAGALDTTFTITSATLGFATINGAVGGASAGFTLTDTTGNGGLLTGLYANNKMYTAAWNGFPGSNFTDLVKGYGVGAFQTLPNSEIDTLPGYRPVGGNAFDMTSQVKFKLSARDLASGTNFYEIVPEPSTMIALGFGAVALLRRRKR